MLQKILLQEFEKRMKNNGQYSLRSFARSLEINSGTLSSILNHRRPVGQKVMAHLLQKLPLTKSEKKKILTSALEPEKNKNNSSLLLTEEILSIIKDWEHYAILCYLQLPKSNHNPGFISKILDLPLAKTLRALTNLESTGLITRETSSYKVNYKSTITTQEIPSTALRSAHHQYIVKANEALDKVPIELRDITGTTMTISKHQLDKAKRLISQFRSELCELLDEGTKDDVYRLNIQLFPLTKQKGELK